MNPEIGDWLNADGDSFITDGFWPLTIEALWSPADVVYSNPVDADEVTLARRPAPTDTVHDIPFQVSGFHMFDGSTAPSVAACFKANYDELRRRVGTPETWGGESTATTVIDPLGVSYVGQIQPKVGRISKESGPVARTVVTVNVVGGELTEEGS